MASLTRREWLLAALATASWAVTGWALCSARSAQAVSVEGWPSEHLARDLELRLAGARAVPVTPGKFANGFYLTTNTLPDEQVRQLRWHWSEAWAGVLHFEPVSADAQPSNAPGRGGVPGPWRLGGFHVHGDADLAARVLAIYH
jgi:hypothetical protein